MGMGIIVLTISPTLAASNEIVHRETLFLVKKSIAVFCFFTLKEGGVMKELERLLSGK
jgi:hypothetical protein